jgi:hypothetical protein
MWYKKCKKLKCFLFDVFGISEKKKRKNMNGLSNKPIFSSQEWEILEKKIHWYIYIYIYIYIL